jgi:hypothetical protein
MPKKVLVFLVEGFEEVKAVTPIDSWRGFHTLCTLSRASLWGGHKVWNPRPIPYENNIPRYSTFGSKGGGVC